MNPSLILTNEESDVTELREVGQEAHVITQAWLVLTEDNNNLTRSLATSGHQLWLTLKMQVSSKSSSSSRARSGWRWWWWRWWWWPSIGWCGWLGGGGTTEISPVYTPVDTSRSQSVSLPHILTPHLSSPPPPPPPLREMFIYVNQTRPTDLVEDLVF